MCRKRALLQAALLQHHLLHRQQDRKAEVHLLLHLQQVAEVHLLLHLQQVRDRKVEVLHHLHPTEEREALHGLLLHEDHDPILDLVRLVPLLEHLHVRTDQLPLKCQWKSNFKNKRRK